MTATVLETQPDTVKGRRGTSAIFEQFLADEMTFMFGNPGTVEQGFLDALEAVPGFTYVLALQETVAVGIADGFARATGRPTLVQLHSGVGLGNAVGMLYQAKRGHSPLVVVAGEAGVRYEAMDAQMAADLVAMAAPVTKYATRVVDPSSLLRVLRRAVKIAATPPMGPVFVALPMDVLDALTAEPVVATSVPSTRVVPAPDLVERAAALLLGAEQPLVLVGDGVTGAEPELSRVAEQLGADVWSVDSSCAAIGSSHPLARGWTGHMFGSHSAAIVGNSDAVLIVGTYVFPEVFPLLSSPFQEGSRIVHIDLDSHEIAKNFPVDLGLVADPKPTLLALSHAIELLQDSAGRRQAESRLAQRRAERQDRQNPPLVPRHDPSVFHSFLRSLAEHLPADAMIFDEGLTASPTITDHLPPELPGHYFLTRGGSLGVGIPGAIGVKLAHPDKTVVGFTGDGGSMYTFQALWTAARYDVGAKFVVCNNRSYELLNVNIREYWRERGVTPHALPSSFDLSHPEIDFAHLARSLGVDAVRVDEAGQVDEAVELMTTGAGPFLVDVRTP